MTDLKTVCANKTLEEIWESPQVKQVVKEIREELQQMVNQWASDDHKRHIPVYISLKPKIKTLGLYFEKARGNGSIVLFPIRANGYPVTSFYILDRKSLEDTLRHEYSHHLTGTAHGKGFQENLKRVNRRR